MVVTVQAHAPKVKEVKEVKVQTRKSKRNHLRKTNRSILRAKCVDCCSKIGAGNMPRKRYSGFHRFRDRTLHELAIKIH